MSWLERRSSGCYHVVFRLGKQRFKKSLKTNKGDRALAQQARLDENIRLVESGRLAIPEGAEVATFLLSDGRLNGKVRVGRRLTLTRLFEGYFGDLPDGSLEGNSLMTVRIHMNHFKRVLGEGFSVKQLKFADLQQYVRKRSQEEGRRGGRVSSTTIKKELATLSAVWTWARMNGGVEGAFPNRGLKYPKSAEKPPFQTRQEIERQLVKGNLSRVEEEELWDCLYLTIPEIEEVVGLVREEAGGTFVYPMCVLAAHTGALGVHAAEPAPAMAQDWRTPGGMGLPSNNATERTF